MISSWDGQNDIVFNKRFYASPDSIPIYPGNELNIEVRGDHMYMLLMMR